MINLHSPHVVIEYFCPHQTTSIYIKEVFVSLFVCFFYFLLKAISLIHFVFFFIIYGLNILNFRADGLFLFKKTRFLNS